MMMIIEDYRGCGLWQWALLCLVIMSCFIYELVLCLFLFLLHCDLNSEV